MEKKHRTKKRAVLAFFKILFWFSTGVLLGLFFFSSFLFIFFEKNYANRVYPGVLVGGYNFGGKTKQEVQDFFNKKNNSVASLLSFTVGSQTATASAKDLDIGYEGQLLATQAYSIGRSQNVLTNIALIFQAYVSGINLPEAYTFSQQKVDSLLVPLAQNVNIEPSDALFTFQDGKVIAFHLSSDGQEVDIQNAIQQTRVKIPSILHGDFQLYSFSVPIRTLKPKVTSDKANNLGIKELIGVGTSLFAGSIESRIYNITLAASKINGVLVLPDEEFSFDKTLGDVSAFTGYRQAYIIQNGKTILGDGGGVCQVSTTLFRAVLNAGLPVTERHAHAYRVHYYEEDSGPGIDATIYVPSVDFKFKNDTANAMLIQANVDPTGQRLTFYFYGTKDGRQTSITAPVITSQTPAPEPLYQDDPTLPKGTVKQIDFAAGGATTYFTREVKKDGKVVISDKFVSNFRPWQAIFLRGTKE